MHWSNLALTDCDGTYRDTKIGKCGATHYKEVTYTCSVGKTYKGILSEYALPCDSCGNSHKKGVKLTYTKFEVDNS